MRNDQCWWRMNKTQTWTICWYGEQFHQVKHKEEQTVLNNSADRKLFHWYKIKDNVRWFRWYLPDCRRTGKWCRTGFCRPGACSSQARALLCHWENAVRFQASLHKSISSFFSRIDIKHILTPDSSHPEDRRWGCSRPGTQKNRTNTNTRALKTFLWWIRTWLVNAHSGILLMSYWYGRYSW